MRYEFSYSTSSGVALGGIGSGSIEIRADGLFYNADFLGFWQKIFNPEDIFFVNRIGDQLRILASTPYIHGSTPYEMPWVRPVERIVYDGEPPFAHLNYGIASATFLSPTIPLDLKRSIFPLFYGNFNSEGEITIFIKPEFLFSVEKGKDYIKIITKEGEIAIKSPNMLNCGLVEDIRKAYVDLRLKGYVEDQQKGNYVFVSMSKSPEFTFSWYFPNYEIGGEKYRRYYAKLFKDSVDASASFWEEKEEIISKTAKFHDLIYSPKGVEQWIADLIGSQISTLKKVTVLLEDGDVAIWEGLWDPYFGGPLPKELNFFGESNSGVFNTTDLSFYYAPALLALYPELLDNLISWTSKFLLKENTKEHLLYSSSFLENLIELKKDMIKDPSILVDLNKMEEEIAKIVKKTGKDPAGRVPHFFIAPFRKANDYRMLGNQVEFPLQLLLLYAYTGKSVKGDIIKVFESIRRTQLGDLGLPYHTTPAGLEQEFFIQKMLGTQEFAFLRGYNYPPISFQTFDGWSMLGYSSYTSIMWYSMLFLMRKILNIEEYKEMEEKSKGSLKQLWNGKYYDLWYDPITGIRDTASNIAQVMGFWYCRLMGYEMGEEDVLKAIVKNNLIKGEGTVNGIYPGETRPSFSESRKYKNNTGFPFIGGPDVPWGGMELALASHLLYAGMREEAEKVLKEIYERYKLAGMFWKHVEWGSYYSRNLDAITLIWGYEGLSYNKERKSLKIKGMWPMEWIFMLPSAWGKISIEECLTLEIEEGYLEISEVEFKGRSIKLEKELTKGDKEKIC
ncbi:GH116 family glycosyl hydrolase [Acidianus sp. RZ1]|uniref:GH116 family glycosyl hydrolase n=1 Tax=Acidianus sp. RZ1 TaxID=1540082 RepID=UPI001491B28E|nr:GH116 family glycosyl hydrolase [Acidianus sp. RZ1]NON63109.1 hypothetical protein [Acidianus sp. RZ1]